MKRVIVDFKKLNKEILEMLVEKFPNGYDAKDIIVFRNAQNEIIEAVEVRTEDTIYLVKVSKRLADTMENYDEDDDTFDDDETTEETPEMADEDADDDF
jgi:phosphopantothenoylcysteine synthetase/decarboxylase